MATNCAPFIASQLPELSRINLDEGSLPGQSSRATEFREPLNKSRAGATGAMRDATKTRVCFVARLAHILDMGCAALLASITFWS